MCLRGESVSLCVCRVVFKRFILFISLRMYIFTHPAFAPPKNSIVLFCLPTTYVWGFFFIYLSLLNPVLLSPRSTESLDVFCWSCSVLRLNPLCTQQPVFLVSCTGGGSSYCGQGGALGSVLLWLCGSVGSSTVCMSSHTASLPHTVHCRGFLWVVLCQWDKTWLNCVSLSVAWKHPEPWCDLSCIYPLIVYVFKHIILELED